MNGIPLACKHCGNGEFAHRRAQLNTRLLSFFDLDWLNATEDVYACTRCGFLQWFLPEAVDDPLLGEPAALYAPLKSEPPPTAIECLACRATIPSDANTCPECGWSYEPPEQDTGRKQVPE